MFLGGGLLEEVCVCVELAAAVRRPCIRVAALRGVEVVLPPYTLKHTHTCTHVMNVFIALAHTDVQDIILT